MAVPHALSFPRLFAPDGLIGAGPQTTAWLYMIWHAGFPLAVIGYALLRDSRRDAAPGLAVAVTCVIVAGRRFAVRPCSPPSATNCFRHHARRRLHAGAADRHRHGLDAEPGGAARCCGSGAHIQCSTSGSWWSCRLGCSTSALSAMLNAGRFDLGFYAGRLYGLMAATLVLLCC